MAKRNELCKKSHDLDTGTLTFEFAHGVARTVVLEEYPDEVRPMGLINGFRQKLGDSYAGADTPQAALEAFDKTHEMLMSGLWTERREGVGEEPIEVLAKAIAAVQEAKGKEPNLDAIKAFVESQDSAWRRKMRSQAEVAVELAKIRGKATTEETDPMSIG